LLSQLNPGTAIIQFAGANDLAQLSNKNLNIYPKRSLSPMKMANTFGYLGPRPIVIYNAIGLKVAQAIIEGKKQNLNGEALDKYVLANSPAQLMVKNEM